MVVPITQAMEEEEKAALSRRERDRLRMQDKIKRENLEKLRNQQNRQASEGEVLGYMECMHFELQRTSSSLLLHHHPHQDDRGKKRLEFLLRQAEVFQHFAPDLAEARKKKYVCVDVCVVCHIGVVANNWLFVVTIIMIVNFMLHHPHHHPHHRHRGKGRHGGTTEENEDAELLADETANGELAGHRLQVQPSIITGGKLREYQMQGLNWMIHLYDNGINGILADEMV